MNLLSTINDERIGAKNSLIEISINEYLGIAKSILEKNVFQRRKVKRTSTVYSLLRTDLRKLCTIPPIVMALTNQASQNIEELTNDNLSSAFVSENLIILDGLQRTYNLIEVSNDLNSEFANQKVTQEEVNKFLNNKIRVEVYTGLNKIGILYRMLTLNTGQTPMTTRHQIEILYSDYLEKEIDGIQLFKEVDGSSIKKIGQFQFDDAIEGFNSYLERDETGMDRLNILDNITNLEKLSLENSNQDIFQSYIKTYTMFMKHMDTISGEWAYNSDEDEIESIFGKNILSIFSKVQCMSSFGASVGRMKENVNNQINSFTDIESLIPNIAMGNDINNTMMKFLKVMNEVRQKAKKIGLEQRYYMSYLFKFLFLEGEDSYLNFSKAIDISYKKYEASK